MRDVPFADLDVDDVPAFLLPEPPAKGEEEPPERAVVLPPSGDGLRSRRRRQRRRHAWRRTFGFVVLAVAVAAALVLVAVHPWRGGEGASPRRPAGASRQVPLPSSAVLVQQDAQGGAVSVTLLVANQSGGGGHVVLVPPATMTEIPSFGLDGVGKALGLGGPPLLHVTLENLLGVPLPPAVLANDAQLTGFVQAAGPLNVDVPATVEQADATGAVSVLWNGGPATVAPSDVPRFLSVRGQGNDLGRLDRHQSFWTAWLARVAHDPSVAAALPPDFGR